MQLTYNGSLLDSLIAGYMTLNVDGRGLLDRDLSTVNIPGRDGTKILSQRIPPRMIEVFFHLKAANSQGFIDRLNLLHNYLKSDSDVIIQFSDEDYYRYGRLASVENPPHDYFMGIGSFELLCQDPFKYKNISNLSGSSIAIPGTALWPYRINSITATITTNRTGFTITNATTARKIILTGAFAAGQTLQILPDAGLILLNSSNIMNRLDFTTSDWRKFEIRSGDQITASQSVTLSLSERAL